MKMEIGTYKPIHGKKGRFTSRWNGLKKALRISGLVCAVIWAFYGTFKYGAFEQARTLIAYADSATSTIPVEMQGKSLEQLEAEVIHDLASKENLNGLPAYLDDNKAGTLSKKDKLSYGCMSYKLSTVERHYKGIHGTSLNDLDAALLALDCEKAKALAQEAIFGKLNAVNEWMGATDKMKMKVGVIREMI